MISFDKFRGAEDLAAVWCEYVEFELRHGDFDAAEKLLQRATTEPKRAVRRGNAKPQGNALAVLGAGSGGVITHNYDKGEDGDAFILLLYSCHYRSERAKLDSTTLNH